MRTRSILSGWILALGGIAAAATAADEIGGKFYGVFWDGSQEHFVTVDPVAGTHTSLAVIPDVKLIDATFRVFDPDSGLYAFIGGATSNTFSYQVVDAATGNVLRTIPRNDNLKNPLYDPGTGRVYGTWWSDSTVQTIDSLGIPRPGKLRGTEYFASIDPRSGARTDTPIPGLLAISASSQYLDSDSGHYVIQGQDTLGVKNYYVIHAGTGSLVAKTPLSIKLDFPVYNPTLGAVQGLWWSDSTVREFDSLGRPKPVSPPQIKGTEYFVTVFDDSTTTLVELPGVKYIANFNRALDTDSGRYVFTGMEASGGLRYFVVNAATGALLSNTAASGKVNHLVYAPHASSTYLSKVTSVRTEAKAANRTWSLRQRPGRAFDLSFNNPSGATHAFTLLDPTGKSVLAMNGIRSESARIDASTLKAGVYFFTLRNGKTSIATGKILIR